MDKPISHDGVIASVSERSVSVRIVQTTACAGCKVASRCTASEAREKLVSVGISPDEASQWHEGQAVVVTTQGGMAARALMVGFGLPLLLMLAVLVATLAAGCSEGLAALLMLASLVPYYIGVWLCRGRLARSITFRLEAAR